MVASWFPLSLLYTWTVALSVWAANTCDEFTARQLVGVEVFLKVDRRAGDGWNSWMQIPTSLSVADAGVLPDAKVDATKHSESMTRVKRGIGGN